MEPILAITAMLSLFSIPFWLIGLIWPHLFRQKERRPIFIWLMWAVGLMVFSAMLGSQLYPSK